jgi:hypothetical protein
VTGDRWASIAVIAACLVLVISSLLARRWPVRRIFGLAAIWAAIFAIAALITAKLT